MDIRKQVVAEALTWVGTPYHHHGTVKHVGADCITFMAAVYESCNVVPRVELEDYSQQWMLHRSEEKYLAGLNEYCTETTETQKGNIVVWKIGRCFSHAAIIVDWPKIIHAYLPDRYVVEGDASKGDLAIREFKIFDPWGKK